jgi:Tfp pilus assembly protein PilX
MLVANARSKARGAALPVVLAISSMMLTTSAAWFETSITGTRSATNMRDYLQAFHAADAALTLCARMLRSGTAPAMPAAEGEPVGWKRAGAFEGPASFAPVPQWPPQWPYSARTPQCLIETMRLAKRPQAQAYLLTARGFGATATTQAWLQLEIVFEGDAMERHWRHIVARPLGAPS